MAEAIRIGSPGLVVALRRNARARRMILRVGRAGGAPCLTLPPRASLADAERFVLSQEAWLRRQLAARPPALRVEAGATLPFAGGTLEVRCGGPAGWRPEAGALHVPGPAGRVGPQVRAHLQEAARAACVEAAERHAGRLGRRPGRITLRDTRSRWGSCTADGDLMFSWRLIMAPPAVLDYVAAHEVAHMVELNHSRRFWALVAELCPGYGPHRAWLQRHGMELLGVDFSGG